MPLCFAGNEKNDGNDANGLDGLAWLHWLHLFAWIWEMNEWMREDVHHAMRCHGLLLSLSDCICPTFSFFDQRSFPFSTFSLSSQPLLVLSQRQYMQCLLSFVFFFALTYSLYFLLCSKRGSTFKPDVVLECAWRKIGVPLRKGKE